MFYLISKIFSFLLYPIGLLLITLIILFKSNNRTKNRKILTFCILLTYFCSVNFTIKHLEYFWLSKIPNENRIENYDITVVLTGGIFDEEYGIQNMKMNSSGDRIWQALNQYKSDHTKKIIISGGNVGILVKKEITESEICKEFLLVNGVPDKDIFVENKARNTIENARNVKALLPKINSQLKICLITSDFHMPRALACFKKSGIKAYPLHYKKDTISNQKPDVYDFIPNANSLAKLELVIREIMGFLVYRVMGYC